MVKFTILIPEHSRPLRLKQVIRNIRETCKYHHEIVVVLDRADMEVQFDYPPELVDPELAEYLKENDLLLNPSRSDWGIDDIPEEERKRLFTLKKWIEMNEDYFRKYDVRIEECPLDYEIKGVFKQYPHPTCAKGGEPPKLRNLGRWDFGADVVANWAFEELDFESELVYYQDDDMIYLFRGWDEKLLECVNEEDAFAKVWQPKVWNIRQVDPHEDVGLAKEAGMYEIRQARENRFLDVKLVKYYVEKVNEGRVRVDYGGDMRSSERGGVSSDAHSQGSLEPGGRKRLPTSS
ncbi:MAG TPA: hypothetical protein ENF26_02940 [Methanomicrobia archaeon]|mgnify:CR=1 FL=1|nr:hypothetical protein [Methanomicrobia archaeon]HEX59088.1 hypothetical protein [Methanomicrobia archaeon]